MKEKIIEGLMKLDTENDNHWTEDGLPKIAALKFTVGPTLTREDVNEVAPNFTRSNPVIGEVQNDTELSTAGTQETEPQEVAEVAAPEHVEPETDETHVEGPTEAHDLSTNVGHLTVHVACDVDTLFKALAKDLPNVDIKVISQEELEALDQELRDGMNADVILLSAVNKLVNERNKMHAEVVEELEHRKPKSHLADQLSAFRNTMAGCQHVVNQPRMMVRNGIKTR